MFIDSEEENWNIDPELLEVAIKDRIAKTSEYDSNFWLCTITFDPNLKIKGQDNTYNETPETPGQVPVSRKKELSCK